MAGGSAYLRPLRREITGAHLTRQLDFRELRQGVLNVVAVSHLTTILRGNAQFHKAAATCFILALGKLGLLHRSNKGWIATELSSTNAFSDT